VPLRRQAGTVLRQQRQDLAHRLVKIHLHRFAFPGLAQMLRDIFPGLLSSFSIQMPSRLILALMLRSAAGDAHPYRAGSAVTRQTDHADIVGEVFAAELRAEARFCASSSSCSS
jgi:hypothetical protein